MVQDLFDKNIFMYIMLGLCACGVLLKVILDIEYSHLIKASDNMGTAKNRLTQMMKKKFETCYKLKIGVNNVDIFVDKYVYRHKFCGILLSTWENIGGQILMLCLLIGSVSAVLGLIYECGKQDILSTFSVGILTSGLLIFLEGMINFAGKKELIRLNMKDYLENFFKVRLEQELLHPELIEQYKKDLGSQEDKVVGQSPILEPITVAEFKSKSELKTEKRIAVKQQKELKKAKAKEEKEQEKEERRLAIIKRREIIDNKRLQMRETQERIKRETKLAIEQKREQERAEIEKKKAEAKALEESRKEDKRRQEEIKKALMLEKQAIKEDKQKHVAEHKTLAQEKKENLKKEIQERRTMDGREQDIKLESISDNTDIVTVTELEDKDQTVNGIDNSKITAKVINNKKQKQLDPSEDKLIEDILKEFLA